MLLFANMKQYLATIFVIVLFSTTTISAQQTPVDWQAETAKVLIELSKEKALREAAERERDAWKSQSEVWRNLFLEEREIVKKTILLDANREKQIEHFQKQLAIYEEKSRKDSETINTLSDKLKNAGKSKWRWFAAGVGTGFVLRSTISF